MRRLLRILSIFLARVSSGPAEIDWTVTDARGLQAFMRSSTGRRLEALLVREIAAANERAAMSKGNPFEAGWACGYRGLYAWFETLSAIAAVNGEQNEDGDLGSVAGLEHLDP